MNSFLPLLAEISGDSMIHSLMYVLIIGICLGIIWWLGNYVMARLGAPPMAATAWTIIFVVLICFALINFLLGMSGHPLVRW